MNKKVTLEERALNIDRFFTCDMDILVEEEKKLIYDQFDFIEFTQENETKMILMEVLPEKYYKALAENCYDDDNFLNYLRTLCSKYLDELEQIIDYIKKNLRAEILKTAVAYEEEFLDDEEESFPSQEECYWGTGYHVGSGVYCDEDGDNWEF